VNFIKANCIPAGQGRKYHVTLMGKLGLRALGPSMLGVNSLA